MWFEPRHFMLWISGLYNHFALSVYKLNGLFSKNENIQISLSILGGGDQFCQSDNSGSFSMGVNFLIWHLFSLRSLLLWLLLNKNIEENSDTKYFYRTFWNFVIEIWTFLSSRRLKSKDREKKKEAFKRNLFATSPEFLDYSSSGLIFSLMRSCAWE